MKAGAREVDFFQQLVELCGACDRTYEHYELVEFEGVNEVDQFAVLLVFRQRDVVLLEPVEGDGGRSLGDVDLERL